MIKPIFYREHTNLSMYSDPNCPVQHLQFTVVNNPQPDQYFEDYQLRDMTTNEEVPMFWYFDEPRALTAGLNVQNKIIFTPYYIVTYITMINDITYPMKNVIRPTMPIHARSIPENENGYFNQMQGLGLNMLFMNQYGIFLDDEGMDTTFFADDHVTPVASLPYRNRKPGSTSLWKNITWHPETTVLVSAKKNCQFLSFAPYVSNTRHNLEKSQLHKFEEYFIKAGDTVQTTVFDDATYSLLHVGKGVATINGMAVQKYEFYEHDARLPATITAQEDCVIVQTSKVPTIDFTGLITE